MWIDEKHGILGNKWLKINEKPLAKNTFFKSFPEKALRFCISKIRIWIWSEESTLSVHFMDSWSVFGFAQKHAKSVFGFGTDPHLDSPKKRALNFYSRVFN